MNTWPNRGRSATLRRTWGLPGYGAAVPTRAQVPICRFDKDESGHGSTRDTRMLLRGSRPILPCQGRRVTVCEPARSSGAAHLLGWDGVAHVGLTRRWHSGRRRGVAELQGHQARRRGTAVQRRDRRAGPGAAGARPAAAGSGAGRCDSDGRELFGPVGGRVPLRSVRDKAEDTY